MKKKSVPTLILPIADYQEMLSLSNRRLVCAFRKAVLSPERVGRFSPRPPAEHDAYLVQHGKGCISIRLYVQGAEVFRCNFVPPTHY